MCLTLSAGAQEHKSQVYVYGGPQFSMAKCGGNFSTGSKTSFLAGAQYERNLTDLWGYFVGAEYSAKGVNDLLFTNNKSADYSLNYVQLNLGAKIAKTIWGIDGMIEVGPYVAYGIGGSATHDGNELGDGSFGEFTDNYDGGAGFKRFDAGFNVAIGVERWGLRLMGGYQQGLLGIADKEYISNGYKNYGFYIKLGYAFGL